MNLSTSSKTNHGVELRKRPEAFAFLDKGTGTQRFAVKANPDGSLAVDQAAALLAIQCLMRRQSPDDFTLMIVADEKLLNTVKQEATKLIEACPAIQEPVQLTGRQQQVLRAILQLLSNKEIGALLNISARTAKYHVSMLLAKFEVQDRAGLVRKAAGVLSHTPVTEVHEEVHEDFASSAGLERRGINAEQRNSPHSVVPLNVLERRCRR